MNFNPEHQYGDAVYIPKDEWPLSEKRLAEIMRWTVQAISKTIPVEYHGEIKYFVERPPDVEFISDKDPLAAEHFNYGYLAWKYPGKRNKNPKEDRKCYGLKESKKLQKV